MALVSTGWEWLEHWRARMFLVGGVLLLIQSVSDILAVTMDLDLEALAFVTFIGLILSYIGLLGLYPLLVDPAPRLSRAGLGLVLIPVVLLVVLTVGLLVSSGPPFSESVGEVLFTAIFAGFTLGVVLLGGAIVRTQIPSRAVGISLLGYAAGWVVLLGASIINGFPISDSITFVADVLLAVSLLATGYLLYVGSTPLESTESASTSA